MHRKDWLALLALSAIWGSSYLFIAIGTESMPPLTLVSVRLLIGAAALQIVLQVRRTRRPRDPKTLAALAFMGLTNNIVPFALITWAEMPGPHQVTSGLTAVLVAVVPIFTVLIAHFVLHDERFTALKVSGVLVGFVGVAVLMWPSIEAAGTGGEQAVVGGLAVVIASASYAVAAVFSRKVLSPAGVAPIVIGAMQMTWSVVLLLPVALIVERPAPASIAPEAWLAVMWLGLLGSGVAYILYFGLIQNVGPTRATMVTYLGPIVAVILGAVFRQEALTWSLLAGMGLIVGGAAVVNRRPKPAPIPAEAPAPGAQ